MDVGSPVQFRGVNVGKVIALEPGSNGVAVTVEIEPASLLIPRDVVIAANQSGFIGEVSIDIAPQKILPTGAIASGLDPFSDCNSNLIICDGDRLQGQSGVSFDELIRSTTRLANLLGDPELLANINLAARSVGLAGTGVNQLTKDARQDLALLTREGRRSLVGFSIAANSVTRAANQVDQLASGSGQTVNQLGDQLGQTANRVGNAADQVSGLVQTNRGSLVATLNNLNQASGELRVALENLTPALNQLSQGELIQNLETLSANAVQASANLRDLSATVNSPTNLLVLQQTLDSARVTFQNTQKISTDLDELTGDPAFRRNLRDLVNGLSQLVSSTQELEKQVQVAHQLKSATPPAQAARQAPPKPTKASRFK
jgi:phospholipid/cholesterol/gamma-HCH transport system substrate-binding protein